MNDAKKKSKKYKERLSISNQCYEKVLNFNLLLYNPESL